MDLYFAPLEGLTDSIFRQAHAACFVSPNKYFMPFLSPNQNHKFTARELRDVLPENNAGLTVVPQLLTNHAGHFLWAAGELAAMGYSEVNLNLGCPSGTVTAKKKGAGQLADLAALDAFLDEVCARSPLPVSVKTRLGMREPDEFDAVFAVLNRFPLAELILHPRVREEFYRGVPHEEAYPRVLAESRAPVCCNGDLFTPAGVRRFAARFPQAHALMLGRGALANPGLFGELCGQPRASREQLRNFHERLYEGYRAAFSGERPVLCRMKELWQYLRVMFDGAERFLKPIRKASSLREYEAVTAALFRELPVVSGDDYPAVF